MGTNDADDLVSFVDELMTPGGSTSSSWSVLGVRL